MSPIRAWIVSLLVASCVLGIATPARAANLPVTFSPDRLSAVPVQDQLVAALGTGASAGRPVRLGSGVLRITRTMWVPPRSTLLLDRGAVIRGSIPGQSLIRLQSGSRVQGGTIENSSNTDCMDIDLAPRAVGAVIDGMTLRGARANSVYVAAPGVSNLSVVNNRFVGVTYGVLVNPGAVRADRIRIVDNEFHYIYADAIEINAAIPRRSDAVRNVDILHNTIGTMRGSGDSSGFAIGVAGVQRFSIRSNSISGARHEAIHLEDRARDGVVAANLVKGGGNGHRPAIAIYRTVDSVDVRANRITGFDGDGIAVLWDQLGSSSRIATTRNVLRNVRGSGIVVGGNVGTGPFVVRSNAVLGAKSDAIVILGTHGRSVVSNNLVRSTSGAVTSTRYAGRGQRLISGNGAMAGRPLASVVGDDATRGAGSRN